MSDMKRFAELVLPPPRDGAFIGVHYNYLGDNKKKYWSGRASANLDQFVKDTYFASRTGLDVYVCMSLQRERREKTARNGHPYYVAIRERANAVALSSFFMDIDVKEGAYPTQRDAILALKGFIDKTGMPYPTVMVSSGTGGMHVYWGTDAEMTADEWQPYANALASAASQHGMKFDSACTVDAARILRIPETSNYKTEPPTPVTVLYWGQKHKADDIRACLEPYVIRDAAQEALANFPKRAVKVDNSELSAGISEGSVGKFLLDDVAAVCPFIKLAVDEGGKSYNNPQWVMTASAAVFIEDGEQALHTMSNGHATYDAVDTARLYNRMEKTKDEKDLGWPKCATIDRASQGATVNPCASCKLLTLNKSPFTHAGKPTPTAASFKPPPIVNVLPDNYVQDVNGLIYKLAIAEDGSTFRERVSPYPLNNGWLQKGPWRLHFTTRLEVGAADTKCEILIDNISAKDGLLREFARHAILMQEAEGKRLKEFIVAWIQKLQQTKGAVRASTSFGWVHQNGRLEGFSYAGNVWSEVPEKPAAVPDAELGNLYTPKGTIDTWSELSKVFIETEKQDLAVIVASAFAAPLIQFTGHEGVLLSTYSKESGAGKSTAMKVAQAVWGDSVRGLQSLNDTGNAVLGKLGQLNSLPMYWDELKTEEDTKKFVNIAFALTLGTEKARMRQDTSLRSRGSWKTMLVSASNDSVMDAILRNTKSTNAGGVRVFEYTVRPSRLVVASDAMEIARMTSRLQHNHGWAGLEYAKYIGEHRDTIAKEVASAMDRIWRAEALNNDERYWFVAITSLIMGAYYANKIGLTNFNIAAMNTFLMSCLSEMRSDMKSTPSGYVDNVSIVNLLTQYLKNQRARNTILTDKIHAGQGRPRVGDVKILGDTRFLEQVNVQVGKEDGMIRISRTHFNNWMIERGYSAHILTKTLVADYGARLTTAKIGAGTPYAGGNEYIIELSVADPKLWAALADGGIFDVTEAADSEVSNG